MRFLVRTICADNTLARLTLDARDEADARLQIAQRGLAAASLQAQPAWAWPPAWLAGGPSGAARLSVLLFAQELLALLTAGLSIVEALEALLARDTETPAGNQAVLAQLLAALRDGQRFSQALAAHPAVFSPLFIGLVRSAEGTSDLPLALQRCISYEERVSAVRTKLLSASIYPAILLGVGAAVTLFLVGFVVPKFAAVYQGSGRPLPWLSQLMLDWGGFAAAHGSALAVASVVGLLLAGLGLRRVLADGGLAALLAWLPGVAPRLRIHELARLYLTLGMLAEGGIAIVPALATARAVTSPALRGRLDAARDAVASGAPLSRALASQGLVTPVSLRLLRVGERSGNLGALLTQAANFHDGEVSRWIDRFSRSVEPLLMVAIGLIVGLVVVMLYMPIFDLAGSL